MLTGINALENAAEMLHFMVAGGATVATDSGRLGNEQPDAPAAVAAAWVAPWSSVFVGMTGLVSLGVGILIALGRPKDVLWPGVGSLILGCLAILASARHALIGFSPAPGTHDASACSTSLNGVGLVLAGVLLLVCRRAYQRWKDDQRLQSSPHGPDAAR